MSFSLVYLVGRLFYRIQAFLFDWYVGGFRRISHATLRILERFDEYFALRITLQHFFEPLYQDHTLIGHALGLIFRCARAVGGIVFYAGIVAGAIIVYLAWAAIPLYIVYRGLYQKPEI